MSIAVEMQQNASHVNKNSLFLRFKSFPLALHASNNNNSNNTNNISSNGKKRSASYCEFSDDRAAKKSCINHNDIKSDVAIISNRDFIEVSSFLKVITEAVIIDCRLFRDYLNKRIQNSVHINCLDSITRKRLLTNKLSVKDLISCDMAKKKIENLINNKNGDGESAVNELLIVLYDGSTNNENELINQNPLKLVLDNIKNTLNNVNCKILKGGFEEFAKSNEEFCVKKICTFSFFPVAYNSEENLKLKIENAKISKILDHLYLGNENDAKNKDLLVSIGITHVINVTKNIPCYHMDKDEPKIEYMRVPVNDGADQDIKQYFEGTNKFIEDVKIKKGKVLVHCQAGISRSSTIVIAYLMNINKLTLENAYSDVKKIRPIVEPNFLFYSQLHSYESNLPTNVQTL